VRKALKSKERASQQTVSREQILQVCVDMSRLQDYSYTPLYVRSTSRNPYCLLGVIAAVLASISLVSVLLSSHFGSVLPIPGTSKTSKGQLASASVLNSTLGVSLMKLSKAVTHKQQFERILAISLPERSDHRDALTLASAVSDFHIEFVDGVRGESVPEKALPSIHTEHLPNGVIGSWRAHMNALSQVVENGWSTTLIFEDDVDWDVRLKSILQDFAVASDATLKDYPPGVEYLDDLLSQYSPDHSPYGSNWDILWLGHCYMEMNNETGPVVLKTQDDTVPAI
jgi:hypothetical protein